MVSKRLGLLIATIDYSDPQLPPVADGSTHINDLVDVLRSPQIGGFSLTVLIDPNVDTARSAIVSLLTGRDPDDLVLLYFVGHCVRKTGDTLFLTLRETSRLDLEKTALPAEFVRQQLQGSAANEQIIVVDSLLGSVTSAETPVDRDLPLNVGLNFCVANCRQAVLAASDYLSFGVVGTQYVPVRTPQPPLAESIVRGLRSRAADDEGNRRVTVNGLLNYLKDVGSVRKDEMRAAWMSEGAGDLLVAAYPDKATEQPRPRFAVKPEIPPGPPESGLSIINESVKFTAYRPAILVPGKWRRMIVFAHLDEPSTLMEIETRARQILDAEYEDFHDVMDTRFPGVRENEITLVPEVPGIRFNPPRRSFLWTRGERLHEESFFIHAPVSLVGKLARGRISIFFGQLLLAEIALNLSLTKEPVSKDEGWAKGSAKRFRKLFVSYSNLDVKVVEAMQRESRVIGYEYLREVVKLRSSQQWNQRLLTKIADADVFQLFWSQNAAQSDHVEKEWRYAIALQREAFVRPAYWEIPMQEAPEPLRRIRFCYLPGFHTMTDRRKEKDADEESPPAEKNRSSDNRPGIATGVPASSSSPPAKSIGGSIGKSEETGPDPQPSEGLSVKTSDVASSNAPSKAVSQKGQTLDPLVSRSSATDPVNRRPRKIRAWSAILGTVIGGCLLLFVSLNVISRTFFRARLPFLHSNAVTPSTKASPQATPSPVIETPAVASATATPSPGSFPSPTEPLATPPPSPTTEQPSASASVVPSPTASASNTRAARTRHRRHHRLHRRAANPET